MIYRILFGALVLLLAAAGFIVSDDFKGPAQATQAAPASTQPAPSNDDPALKGFKIP